MRIIQSIAVAAFASLSFSFAAGQTIMTLRVDAREAPRKILHVQERITGASGALTLFYPKWIPGEHGPTGPIADLVGIKVIAGTDTLPWRRDLVEMFAIHTDVPAGTKELAVNFDFILPPGREGFSSAASSTAQLLVLSWNQVVLYPLNIRPDSITVTPTLLLPNGWKFATPLQTDGEGGEELKFKSVSLNELIDSPVLTGAHLRRIDVTAGLSIPHFIDVASDGEEALAMPDSVRKAYERLIREADALFGAHHYRHYDFLYTLSDQTAHFGLEHHQGSDDRVDERTLIDDDLRKYHAGLLSHEFVHSWNGKYRRPADLATGDFSTPMKDDLLWVYEGLTQYLGEMLAARSGLRTPEQYREHLALVAAELDNRPGRTWRPLQDAADEAQILYSSRSDWDAYRRSVDFYDEGHLLWLEVDVKIRELTNGKRSLDDFCKLFHGGGNMVPMVKPYTFDDVVAALQQVAPYDWSKHLHERLTSLSPHAPLGGIEMGGWKLVYRDTISDIQEVEEKVRRQVDLRFSLGMLVTEEGGVVDVIPGTAAAKAGLAPGMNIIAVNGRRFSKELLHFAVREAKGSKAPIDILAVNADYYSTYHVEYHGGERYPHLERNASKPDVLTSIISPAAK